MEAIKSNEEVRAQIVAQLRASMNIDPEKPLSETVQNPDLQELRNQILQKAREKMNVFATLDTKFTQTQDFKIDMEDMRTRMLFYRIKNSAIPRMQRDALSNFVRTMAADKRVDSKFIKTISDMISFMEMTSPVDRRSEMKTIPLEKTVDDEMKSMYSMRDKRESMRNRLDSLQQTLSA